jgi:protein-disulfide isomerase
MAECAGRQGKFWEFHDALFAHQNDWAHPPDARGRLTALAKQTGLDIAKLGSCMNSPVTAALIETDLRDADARNVHATPTFLVDDQRCVGDRQLLTSGVAEIKKRLGS